MTALGDSAALGNFTPALKNLNLMALTLYVALAGAEPMLIGFGPDGKPASSADPRRQAAFSRLPAST